MHKNNRLKESISAFFSRFVISFHFLYYSPRPDSTASTMALSASFSSSPSQVNSITSPHWGAGAEHAQNALGVGCELPKGEGDRTFKTHGLFTEVPGGS